MSGGGGDDLLSAAMGTGTSDAARLYREVCDDMVRQMDDALSSKIVHGEQPCDCPGVCVGVVLFGSGGPIIGQRP